MKPTYDLRALVAAILLDVDRYEARRIGSYETARNTGKRLITGGQRGDGLLDVVDAVTRETLFVGDEPAYERFLDSPDAADFVHVDQLRQDIPMDDTSMPWLPADLQDALVEWVENNVEQARELAGLASIDDGDTPSRGDRP